VIAGPILIVAAHPDDEALGCGGTIARLAASGVAVHVLLLGDGVTARGARSVRDRGAIAGRARAARQACKILGARPPYLEAFPDNRFDSVVLLDIVKRVEAVVAKVRPVAVFTHHGSDLNIDHRVTHQAVVTACRPLPGVPTKALYCFETVSSTEWSSAEIGDVFRPQRFVAIDSYLETKLRALDCYADEMRAPPHARSRENVVQLARLRGATVGLPAAEAFTIVREIVD